MGVLYYNGGLVDSDGFALPHDERGYLYGDGVFETMRAYGGRVFAAERHAARMLSSAKALGFSLSLGQGVLAQIFQKTADANAPSPAGELYLRATLTRGRGYGPDLARAFEANLLVYARPLDPLAPSLYARGIAAVYASERRSARSTLARHKTTSYLAALLDRQEARSRGADEALLLDTDGFVLEGACSNLFLVAGGALCTPPAAQNLLPGITRAVVLELAGAGRLTLEESPVRPEALEKADEAFLTNAVQELVPLVRVEGKPVGAGAPGRTTIRLLEAYRAAVLQATHP
ncbi:MAG: aminotransferase class IV [Planctomycetota bacterium]